MDEPFSNVTIFPLHRVQRKPGRPAIFGRPMSPAERQARCRAGKKRRRELDHIRQRMDQFGEFDLDALLGFSLDAAAQFLADRAP